MDAQPVPSAPNLARLAREIAMDILPLGQVLELHRLTYDEWLKISEDPRFEAMLGSMIADWQSAANTKQRVKVKAATGFEALMEAFIEEARQPNVPLIQKIELGKLLCRIGELEADKVQGGGAGSVLIQINMGTETPVTAAIPARPAPVITVESEDISGGDVSLPLTSKDKD